MPAIFILIMVIVSMSRVRSYISRLTSSEEQKTEGNLQKRRGRLNVRIMDVGITLDRERISTGLSGKEMY